MKVLLQPFDHDLIGNCRCTMLFICTHRNADEKPADEGFQCLEFFLLRADQFLLVALLSALVFNLLLLLMYLCLLFLNCVEHGPEDRIIVDKQVALVVLSHCFWNDPLHLLRAEADVFTFGFNSQHVVRLVFVA